MNTPRLLSGVVRAMTRNTLRTGFMMLGSFIGVTALTLVVSVGAAAERKVLATVRQLFGASSVLVMAQGTQLMGGPRAEAARLTMDDIAAVAAEVPGVSAWDPQQALPAASVRRGGVTATVRILGASERFEEVWARRVTRGEPFDAASVRGAARVALIGETAMHTLFGDDDALEAEILIGSVSFRVVGVMEPFGTDLHGMDRDNEIVVPISTVMRRLMNVDSIAAAKLIVDDPAHVADTAHDVSRILRARHGLASGQPDDFTIISAVEVQRMVATVQRVLLLYLPLVAGVALLAGGLMSSTLMLASVNERISEIGLRRAIGAQPGDIRLQFLVETAATTLTGGAAGIVAGYAAAVFTASRWQLGDVFSWQAALLGLAASTATGLLAGVLPARRAARLHPVDALR